MAELKDSPGECAISPAPDEGGSYAAFSTDSVPPTQRTDYWHDGVLRRLDSPDSRPLQYFVIARRPDAIIPPP